MTQEQLWSVTVGRITHAIMCVSASRMDGKRLDRAALENELRGILGDVGDMQRQLAALRQEVEALRQQVANLESVNGNLRASANILTDMLTAARKTLYDNGIFEDEEWDDDANDE
jgi:chromosome segregation ATPase